MEPTDQETKDLEQFPEGVRALLADAANLHAEIESRTKNIWDLFVPSDFLPAWKALETVPRGGGVFLEFGSGIGTITLMAAHLGFTAYGIEINPELVTISRQLAKRHGLEATFVEGTFLPSWYEETPLVYDEDMHSVVTGEDGYELLGLDLEDIDVLYVFPWPEEQPLFIDIFQQGGRRGAHLLINAGYEGIKVVRHP